MTPNHIPGEEDQHGASGVRLPDGLRALVFDVGETLVDESRMWTERAQHAGITPFTLMGVIGALIERGEDHRSAWPILRVDPPSTHLVITTADLYPDALDCLRATRSAGFIVGIAGNQPRGVVNTLEALGVEADFVASSADWGVAKPLPQFFEKVISTAQLSPHEIMYVGDRLDNDIIPAHRANMRTALILRRPWGYLHAKRRQSKVADLQLDSLSELTTAITGDGLDVYTADNFTTAQNASPSRPRMGGRGYRSRRRRSRMAIARRAPTRHSPGTPGAVADSSYRACRLNSGPRPPGQTPHRPASRRGRARPSRFDGCGSRPA